MVESIADSSRSGQYTKEKDIDVKQVVEETLREKRGGGDVEMA